MQVKVHTCPPGYWYTDRPLPGGTTKIDRQRSIEGEKGKKKKKRKRKKKEERRGEEERIPHAVFARASSPPSLAGHPRVVAALACDFSPVQGERSRRRGTHCAYCPIPVPIIYRYSGTDWIVVSTCTARYG
ncbi:hypothetical protein BHM03_00037581, partial [Ensete ventricosum]